ncbi:hypothetical protein AMK59_8425 [Oryctes borbonicus]|uniref:E3 ubiquitin-protein ligase APD1-4 middle domain-containing protein n=1 Tax=Oryctes borbonicus TaxID=1629725 RepID=A0A0T6AWD0_9SCAR|nr:hypothetical protein AMK59_8425 [Oryctes borbonicus]
MRGVKRVALFCTMTAILPTILIITPLYLRHSVFADVNFYVAESDVLAIEDGISSVFCNSHTLRMNSSFNAFQLNDKPTISTKRKHIRLKKSMSLPDDTLEYWGFYLLKGATVTLKVCSRYQGSSILVVRGERNLRTCGLLEHNLKKFGAQMDVDYQKVKVTFETRAQEIYDHDILDPNPKDTNTAAEDESDGENYDFINDFHKISHGNSQEGTNFNSTKKSGSHLHKNISSHNRRHARKGFLKKQEELYKLQESLNSNEEIDMHVTRNKRETGQRLDGRIEHGGTALNYTPNASDENDISSFENELLTCYDGLILLQQEFPPSHLCGDIHYLERSEHMEAVHEVASDGYYYYIFYSDNDFVSNDMHAIFDIQKPTYQYNNVSHTVKCFNTTECTFNIPFWSEQSVIVEVPTRDGIEHEEDDITLLVSTCHPRMSIYMIFPISVMFLILGCAFL